MNKKLFFYSLLILSIPLIFSSCTDDGENLNNDRDIFLGTWNVNETCVRDAYDVNIVADPSNSSQVIIKNFWLIGYEEKPPYAIVAGTTLTIPEQSMCDDESKIVKGSGKLDKNKIEWDYTVVNNGADLNTCTATYEKP
jgi:hypothetical protein